MAGSDIGNKILIVSYDVRVTSRIGEPPCQMKILNVRLYGAVVDNHVPSTNACRLVSTIL